MKNKLFFSLYFIVNTFYLTLLYISTYALIYKNEFNILNISVLILLLMVIKQFFFNITNVLNICSSEVIDKISYINYFMYINKSNFYMTIFIFFVPISININRIVSFITNTSFSLMKSFNNEGEING